MRPVANPNPEQIVQANGVQLCAQSFGDPADPAILLIMGSSAPMDWWEDGFCERLAAGGRLVIRYDQRDTGRAVNYPPGAPPYTMRDLAADAVGVLDACGVARAQVVGMSMGGAVAQLVALDQPARVASLVLIATSSAEPGPGDPDLPGMSEETGARFAAAQAPDWTDREAVIEYLTHLARVSASPARPFDDAPFRELAGRVFDRTTDMAATMTNHHAMKGTERWRERLTDLDVPTLVVHGTDDPVVPYGNGVALSQDIPGAELLTLERTGHGLPRHTWDVVVPAILSL